MEPTTKTSFDRPTNELLYLEKQILVPGQAGICTTIRVLQQKWIVETLSELGNISDQFKDKPTSFGIIESYYRSTDEWRDVPTVH